ncbi:MAG: tryptophan 7-halogenase [Nocardiopsaceae bacterium]|nr:tryptophan 7-halogenase [Nocardiopsaceae bacterium]
MSSMESEAPADRPSFDVIILGSGLAGSSLGAILARADQRVLILDAGKHPRFAIGESTIPYTSFLLRLLAERYEVPELKYLATFEGVQAKIAPTGGAKRDFGFLYHRRGEEQRIGEANENVTPKVASTENHLFRQDVDAWMASVAVKYGARLLEETRVGDFEFDDGGVTVISERGDRWRGRFLVDASGFRSPLARKLSLREEPTRMRHHSRSLFTHMTGVLPYEDLVSPRGAHGNVRPWSQGTLHHVFDGGWLWVIPFNNHPRAVNPLVSVGLSLDPRQCPDPGHGPEEEFRRFLADFPSIARQFAGARPARPWVSTGRLQYSSRQTVGYRWCLTSHAAGFVDALYSRGLSNTFEIIQALAWRLLDALRDDDFSVERFKQVEELEQGLLDFNDTLVANSYIAFRDYELWDAWFRLWSLQSRLSIFAAARAYGRFARQGDTGAVDQLERLGIRASIPDYAPVRDLFAQADRELRAVAENQADPQATARRVRGLLADASFLPAPLRMGDPDAKVIHISPARMLGALRWARREAPPEVGELLYGGITEIIRLRARRGEFMLGEELKQALATVPVIGRPFRAPAPTAP